MDTRDGRIETMDAWEGELGPEEVQKRIEDQILVQGEIEDLKAQSKAIRNTRMNGIKAEAAWRERKRLERLARGTKNQKKKARQLSRKSRKKNRSK